MDITGLVEAVRDVSAAATPGLKAALYPPPNTVEAIETPGLILYTGGRDEDIQIIHKGPGEQEWRGSIQGQLLVGREGDTPQEFAAVDVLLTPIVDAFAVDASNQSAVERHPDLFGYGVYQCLITRLRPTLRIPYGGVEFYGAEIFWSFRFDRITGSN